MLYTNTARDVLERAADALRDARRKMHATLDRPIFCWTDDAREAHGALSGAETEFRMLAHKLASNSAARAA